jgi:phosphoesterase RecJ-like protein
MFVFLPSFKFCYVFIPQYYKNLNYLTIDPYTDFVYLRIQILMILKTTDKQIITLVGNLLTGIKKQITVIPHENPDGDAIGSAIGLAEILTACGHDLVVVSPSDYPDFLKWINTKIEVLIYSNGKNKVANRIESSDIIICVDFNDPGRAGNLEKKIVNFNKTKILIDHHPYPTDFCDFTISETHYSSTAELIYDLTKTTGLIKFMNTVAAEALYTGILTDTGSFNHNTSDPNTFKVASELIAFGVDTQKIQSAVYHNFSADRMRLLGYCLNNKMQVYPEYRAAMISITKKELEEFNYKTGDTEGFVNYPLSINNIVFSALFIEKDGWVKASFRSKGNFPVNHFSKNHFGGGGHTNAAGGETKITIEETKAKFPELLQEYLEQLLETEI